MPRQQVSDQFSNERLQTQARPIAVTQAVAPALDKSADWRGLANAFAAGEVVLEQQQNLKRDEDRDRAATYASSMTVSELGKRIKAGDMLTSESPVFAATVQHIWGQNSHDALQREVISKVTTGELKFNSPEEIDTYLTESRNTTLSGASKYAAAGFDKGYAKLRESLMDGVAKVNDKATVEAAGNQASDSLSNSLLKVTAPDFKGTPQEAAGAIMEQYHLLRHTKVMPDAAAKGALTEVITRAAASGKKEVLDALLNSDLPDIGSVRSFVGEAKAQTLIAQGETRYDQGQRQRIDDEVLPFMMASDTGSLNTEKFLAWGTAPENKKYVTAATIHGINRANMASLAHQQLGLEKAQKQGQAVASEYAAQKQVDAALAAGTLWETQGTRNPQVFTAEGGMKDFNVKDYAEKALTRKTQGMPFEQQVYAWASNGLKNPDWEKQLQAGLFNLSSIGVSSTGKPSGQLNDAGARAIELFKQLDAVNADAAKQTAGEGAYKRFSDIAFLMHLGRDASDAAAIATNSASGAIAGSPADKLEKKISTAVDKMIDTPWSEWLANRWGGVQDFGAGLERIAPIFDPTNKLKGLFDIGTPGKRLHGARLLVFGGDAGPAAPGHAMHNTVGNTSQVHGWVKRYATLLAHSGQVGDPEQALKLAADYVSNPAVSVQVNGTLYLRSELPQAPATKTPSEWLERFIDAVPKARAKELKFPGEQVRLEYDEGSRVYRAFVAGLPLTDPSGGLMVYQKGAIQAWYATKAAEDVDQAITRKQTHDQERRRNPDVIKEAFVADMSTRQNRLMTKPQGTASQRPIQQRK